MLYPSQKSKDLLFFQALIVSIFQYLASFHLTSLRTKLNTWYFKISAHPHTTDLHSHCHCSLCSWSVFVTLSGVIIIVIMIIIVMTGHNTRHLWPGHHQMSAPTLFSHSSQQWHLPQLSWMDGILWILSSDGRNIWIFSPRSNFVTETEMALGRCQDSQGCGAVGLGL